MRALRNMLVLGLVVASLGGLGLFSWATHHPDDDRLETVARWPLIGRLATWIRTTYSPDAEPPAADGATPLTSSAPPPAPAEDAATATTASSFDAKPWVWVRPDLQLYHEPSRASAVVATVDVYTNLPQLDERAGWSRVRWRQHDGWLPPPPDDGPPLGRAPEPPGPLAPRPADPDRLARARAVLGPEAIERSIGTYSFLTDSANQVLVTRLARLAPTLDQVYAERFGRRPIGTPEETIVLFENETDYRRLQDATHALVGINAAGHAGWGLAALYRGDRPYEDVEATFVHELTHLMNRRAIGPALPPWLDEGLAEALASGRILPWGSIEPALWGGYRRQVGQRLEISGVRAAHLRVADAVRQGGLPAIRVIVSLDADRFMRDPGGTGIRYTASGLFVRYLLDGESGRYAPAFKAFLKAVAGGGEASGEALRERLGVSWERLDEGFRAWVLASVTGSLSAEADAK